MRYRDTAIQIYDTPMSMDPAPHWSWDRRLTMLLSMIAVLALVGFLVFVVFGIVSQLL